MYIFWWVCINVKVDLILNSKNWLKIEIINKYYFGMIYGRLNKICSFKQNFNIFKMYLKTSKFELFNETK